jgi:soluble lytic murein transglycosylase-like protein
VGSTARAQGPGVTQYSALIQQSAAKYHLAPAYVAAVMDRETGGHNIIGDGGHGHGLMQIDNRSFGPWLASNHNGLDPATNIDKGCSLLRENLDAAAAHGLHGDQALKFAASAYNAGLGGAEAGLRSGNSDARTTGHNYGADVLNRMHRLAADF